MGCLDAAVLARLSSYLRAFANSRRDGTGAIKEQAMEAFTNKRILPVTVLSQGRSNGDESPPDDAIAAFKHVFESIRRYKLFIVKMIGAGALLAVLGSIFMSPTYLATAQLVVSARSGGAADNAGAPGNSSPTGGSDDPTIDTHVTVMSSDAYLRRLLPALRMLDNPANENGSVLRTALSKIKGFLSFLKDQPRCCSFG